MQAFLGQLIGQGQLRSLQRPPVTLPYAQRNLRTTAATHATKGPRQQGSRGRTGAKRNSEDSQPDAGQAKGRWEEGTKQKPKLKEAELSATTDINHDFAPADVTLHLARLLSTAGQLETSMAVSHGAWRE